MNWKNKIPRKRKDLAWRIIDGEAVVIPLENQSDNGENFNVLSATATRVWELIDGDNSAVDIVKKITNEYEIEYEKAETQIKDFLGILLKKRMIDI